MLALRRHSCCHVLATHSCTRPPHTGAPLGCTASKQITPGHERCISEKYLEVGLLTLPLLLAAVEGVETVLQ